MYYVRGCLLYILILALLRQDKNRMILVLKSVTPIQINFSIFCVTEYSKVANQTLLNQSRLSSGSTRRSSQHFGYFTCGLVLLHGLFV